MSPQTLVAIGLAISAMTGVIGFFKPLIETLPGLANTPADKVQHDTLLRALDFLLNLGCILAIVAHNGPLDLGANWMTYGLLAAGSTIAGTALNKLNNGHVSIANLIPGVAIGPGKGRLPGAMAPGANPHGATPPPLPGVSNVRGMSYTPPQEGAPPA